MTWLTTSYTRTPEGLVETPRHLTPDELPAAVFAVEASDNGGRSYSSNGLRWVDPDDAMTWAAGLAMRWFGATDIRVVRVTAPREAGDVTLDESMDRALSDRGLDTDESLDRTCVNGHDACAATDGGRCIAEDASEASARIAREYDVVEVICQTL
jgi:hypothetical protein